MLRTIRQNEVQGQFHYHNDNISIMVMGNFYNGDRMCSCQDILSIYKSYGKKLYDCLDGCGVVILVDRNIGRVYVCTDYFNAPYHLFYTVSRDKICLSDSVFDLVQEFRPNDKAVREFLLKGCVGGEQTTIDGVYKLRLKSYLTVNMSNMKLKVHSCKYTRLRKKVDIHSYNKEMADFVRGCYSEGAGCAISGGYDSNFILHHMHLQNDTLPIDAFCVGGAAGENEIEDARFISGEYPNVEFHSALVDSATLMHFPEIVYALNGQVYERGIFLQYELAKMMSENGIESCLLGECADQICSYDVYHHILPLKVRKRVRRLFKKKFRSNFPYQYAAQTVLKKSGMMMRHFNINSKYPYIRNTFMDTQFSVAGFLVPPKKDHKDFVTATVKNSIASRLQKKGGATDEVALFNEYLHGEIRELAAESRWFDSKSFAESKKPLSYLLSILYLEIFERLFKDGNKDKIPTLQELFPEFQKHF